MMRERIVTSRLPPETITATFLPGDFNLLIEQGRERRSARALGENLLALEEQQNRVGNFLFLNGDDFIHVFLHERKGPIARSPHRDAVGQRGCYGKRHGMAHFDRLLHRRQPFSLHSDNPHARVGLFQRASDAADQAAAADGHDYDFQLGPLLQQLEPQRTLPGDDGVIVERMHEDEVARLGAPQRLVAGLVVIGAVENHVGAESPRGHHFIQRRRQRHADLRGNSPASGMVGNGLGVIARRCGDQTAASLFFRQGKDPVERAALLVGAGHLKVFKLQVDCVSSELGECLRA